MVDLLSRILGNVAGGFFKGSRLFLVSSVMSVLIIIEFRHSSAMKLSRNFKCRNFIKKLADGREAVRVLTIYGWPWSYLGCQLRRSLW